MNDNAFLRGHLGSCSSKDIAVTCRNQNQSFSSLAKAHTAANFNEICSAFELVYRYYAAMGYLKQRSIEMFFSGFSLLPSARIFVSVSNSEVLSTTTVVVDGPAGLPCENAFEQELILLRDASRNIAQVYMFARQPRRPGNMATMQLLKAIFWWCSDLAIDDLLVVVEPELAPYYQTTFGLEQIGSARPQTHASGKDGILMRLNLWAIFRENRKTAPLIRRFLKEQLGSTEPESGYQMSKDEIISVLSYEPKILGSAAAQWVAQQLNLY